MPSFTEEFLDSFKMGRALGMDLPNEIQAAAESGWEPTLVSRIRKDVSDYFNWVRRYLVYLIVALFVPLPFVIISLVTHKPYGILYVLDELLSVFLGALALILFSPIVSITRSLRHMPEDIYQQLTRPLWLFLDVFNILINVGLLCYIFPLLLGNPSAIPIWLLVGLLWLFAPWMIHAVRREALFMYVRFAQLAVLIVITLLTVLSPIPMSHYQWWAQRELANKIRPVEQKEITAQWASIQWFTQEGVPNVWYSLAQDLSYHLFAAPGNDPGTNQELRPVADQATKDLIVGAFLEENAARERQAVAESQKRIAEVAAEVERRKTESEEQLVRDYVFPEAKVTAAREHPTVLIVLDAQQREDSVLSARIAALLGEAGLKTKTAIFTPVYVDSPYLREILSGKLSSERLFHSEDFAAHLLVIQVITPIGTQQPIEAVNMLAVDTVWNVRLISPKDAHVEHSVEIKARGIGFKEADARAMAIERIEAQLKESIPALVSKAAPVN